MSASCLHLLPSTAASGARSWLLEELARSTSPLNDVASAASQYTAPPKDAASAAAKLLYESWHHSEGAIYVASIAGEATARIHLPAALDEHWLPLARRNRDPIRWWRLFRWLQFAQPYKIHFWFSPERWLRRLVRLASPHSRWQVLFRSRGELPATFEHSWSALETAWFDNPLLLERAGSSLAHAGQKLLPWPAEKVPGTTSSATSRSELRKKLVAQLGLPPESILLVTFGPLVREKNQDQLFWSLDQLSCTRDDVRLLVIGDGPDRARLEHHARLHHVDHRVVWLSTVDSTAEYLGGADLYVSADPRERVSRALLEARAAGLPIIAHDTLTNRQIVTRPEEGRLVDPTYLADYAGTLYRWLQSEQRSTFAEYSK